MNKILIDIDPKKANLYFNVIPISIILLSLIGIVIFESSIYLYVFFVSMAIYLLFGLTWRLIIGIISYKLTHNLMKRNTFYRLFIIFSMLNYIIFPLFLIFVFNPFKKDSIYIIGFFIFIAIYGFASNYFQFNFIAKNISLIKFGELKKRNLWPIDWLTLAYFPITAVRTQKIINELLNK